MTPNTVLQMCEYLEIDAVGEWHLIWIAQACGMPAPPLTPTRSATTQPPSHVLLHVCSIGTAAGWLD